jgi:hypothetical protein
VRTEEGPQWTTACARPAWPRANALASVLPLRTSSDWVLLDQICALRRAAKTATRSLAMSSEISSLKIRPSRWPQYDAWLPNVFLLLSPHRSSPLTQPYRRLRELQFCLILMPYGRGPGPEPPGHDRHGRPEENRESSSTVMPCMSSTQGQGALICSVLACKCLSTPDRWCLSGVGPHRCQRSWHGSFDSTNLEGPCCWTTTVSYQDTKMLRRSTVRPC